MYFSKTLPIIGSAILAHQDSPVPSTNEIILIIPLPLWLLIKSISNKQENATSLDHTTATSREWSRLSSEKMARSFLLSLFQKRHHYWEGTAHTNISNSIQTQQLNFHCDSSTQFLAFIASMETFVLFSLFWCKAGNYRISASFPPS